MLWTCTRPDCVEDCLPDRKLIMTQKNSSLATGPIVEKFRHFETASRPPKWLPPLREAGIASFADQGFPTLHDEDWRFTNVAPIVKLPFHLAGKAAVNGAESKVIDESVFARLPGHRLVFVNGFFSAELSRIQPVSGGVRIESLAAALVVGQASCLPTGWKPAPHRKPSRPIRAHGEQRLCRAEPGVFLRRRVYFCSARRRGRRTGVS